MPSTPEQDVHPIFYSKRKEYYFNETNSGKYQQIPKSDKL
jgi:hypothetical protein